MLEASIFSDGDETEMRGEKTGKKKKVGMAMTKQVGSIPKTGRSKGKNYFSVAN